MKYSPEFQSLASLIKNNTAYQVPVSKVKNSKDRINAMSSEDLVKRLGTWVTFNSDGQMVIYGFGQQEVRSTSSRRSAAFSRAYSQARLRAVNNIKNFVAEDIVATESLTNIEKLREYDDGTNAYFSQQKWQNSVKAKESTLNLATEQIRQWKGVHPVSGTDVAGYVVAWTPSNAEQARELQEQFIDSNDDGNGGTQTQPQRQQTKKSEYSISGADDDDI
jgi:hypothetical protein